MPPRCFLGCSRESHSGHLHRFPNPDRFPEQFRKWVQIVGGELNTSDDYAFYEKKRLCDRHFTVNDKNRYNRLNALAVPSLSIVMTTIETIDHSTAVKFEPETNSTVVDMEEDPLKITEDPISYTRIIKDVLSPQTPEGISCPSPIMDIPSPEAEEVTISCPSPIMDIPSPEAEEVTISCPSPIMDIPSPEAEEVTISCTSPIVDISLPKPTVAQQALYRGSDTFAVLKRTYNKFQVPEKCNVGASDSKFQVPEKCNVAASDSKFQVPEKCNVAGPYSKLFQDPQKCYVADRVNIGWKRHQISIRSTYSEFQVPKKCYVADCDVSKENALVSYSDYKCQQRQIRLLKQQVSSLQKRCTSYKSRLAQLSKPSAAFQKVTKNMTEPAKLFTKMQFTQSHKKPGGRRFSSEEKHFSLSLYKTSPKSYSFLAKCFTLPSVKTIRVMLAQEKLEPYLTLDKNAILPSNKTLIQEKLEPYLTLKKNLPYHQK